MYTKVLVSQWVQIEFDKIENLKRTDVRTAHVIKDGVQIAFFPNDRCTLTYSHSYADNISSAKVVFFVIK